MIDPESSTPLYRQLADILTARIKTGALANGRPIPSEVQLQQEFGVARGTARKAVAALRDAGLVHTVMGKGTYVGPLPKRVE
ncbi:MAG TPA: GntR family transcriptional regulator [Micromonosporaceae bacterium]|jgi:DNA-binding GntR family transcriptional regulator